MQFGQIQFVILRGAVSSREEARKDFGGRRVEFRGRKGGEGRVEKKRGESNRMNGTLENMTVPGGVKGIEEEEEKERLGRC